MSENYYLSYLSPGAITHNRNFSETSMKSTVFNSEGKVTLDKAYKTLASKDKLIDFNAYSNRKNSLSKRVTFSDMKSDSSSAAFKTNYKTRFPRFQSFDKQIQYKPEITSANFSQQSNTNSTLGQKMYSSLRSRTYLKSDQIRIDYTKASLAKHNTVSKSEFPSYSLSKNISNTNALPSLWKTEMKIKEQIMNSVRRKFSTDKADEFVKDKNPPCLNKSNRLLSEYLNFKNINPFVMYSGKSEADDENKLSDDECKSLNVKIKKNILKNLKSSLIGNKQMKPKEKYFSDISDRIKLNKRKEIEKIESSDFETGSDYLNLIQRNVQINFQRKYPEYKFLKQNESQLKINEGISIPDYKSGVRANLVLKKPFFHINKNICFPLFVKDRKMLLKIHKKNMRSLENKLYQFSDNFED